MLQIDHEISELKSNILEMWDLIIMQLDNAYLALKEGDKDIAHGVQQREKRVNAYELNIDRRCEDFIALYQPVASDLRYVLANLKINTNLERIGDIACGITEYITDTDQDFNKEMMNLMDVEKCCRYQLKWSKILEKHLHLKTHKWHVPYLSVTKFSIKSMRAVVHKPFYVSINSQTRNVKPYIYFPSCAKLNALVTNLKTLLKKLFLH